MGTTGIIGALETKFTADTRGFDASVTTVVEKLKASGRASDEAAAKIKELGEATDREAKMSVAAIEKARRAFEREAQQVVPLRELIRVQAEQAQTAQLAAMKLDILARSAEHVAAVEKAAAMEKAATVEKAAAAEKVLGKTGEMLKRGLEFAGINLAVGAAVEGLKEMISSTMEAGVQLGKLHQQTGISVENLSVLKYAAAQSGIEFETVTKAFKKLAVTTYAADNGNKTAAKGFQQLGITVEEVRAKGDDMYAVMALVADKFHDMPDGIEKSDTAAKIFGARMGSELIPLLNLGAKALEKYKADAPIFSDEDVERMHKLHQATVNLETSWKRASLTITGTLAPAMIVYLNDFAEGVVVIGDSAKAAWGWLSKIWTVPKATSYAWDPSDDIHPTSSSSLTTSKRGGAKDHEEKRGESGGREEKLSGEPPIPYWLANLNQKMANLKQTIAEQNADRQATADVLAGEAWEKMTALDLSSFQTAFPATKFPGARLAPADVLPPQMGVFKTEMAGFFDDWIQRTTDLKAVTHTFFEEMGRAADSMNGEIAKLMTGDKTNFKGAFRATAQSVSRLGLESAEGYGMKALRLGKLGTKENPMHTKSVDGPSGAASAVGGGLLGRLNNSNWASSLFGGKLFGSGSIFGGARAGGGPVIPGIPYLVGERGPELRTFAAGGYVHDAATTARAAMQAGGRAGGGDTHTWNVDARGTDPALTQANFARALQATHARAVGDASRAMMERSRRTPQ